VASLIGGTLRYALAELAALPRAAVVEDRYSGVFKLDRVRPAMIADGLVELQVRWPNVPIVFCQTRPWPRNGPTATSRVCGQRIDLRGIRSPAYLQRFWTVICLSARSSRTRCWVRTSRMVVTNPTPPTRLPNADQPSAPNQSR